MSRQITVHKLDHNGEEVRSYTGRLITEDTGWILLEAHFSLPDLRLGELLLRTGDRFVERFYLDRWYNVFAVHDVDDDRLKGWYCNITRPARFEAGGSQVYAEDLALDLVVYPDGRWSVLDVEEFAALPISLDERQHCLQALTELQTLAIRRQEPFRALRPR
jgi:protein associated with RNAse G/E